MNGDVHTYSHREISCTLCIYMYITGKINVYRYYIHVHYVHTHAGKCIDNVFMYIMYMYIHVHIPQGNV